MNCLKMISIIFVIMMSLTMINIIEMETKSEPTRSNAPTLQANFVNPSTGYNTTLFNFTIWYQDMDGDATSFINISIDNNFYSMTQDTMNGSDWSRGVQFHYTTYLSTGLHNYYFYTNNTQFEYVRLPSIGSYNMTVNVKSNTTSFLTNPGYKPERPTTTTGVNFTIKFQDTTGFAPVYVNMLLSQQGVNSTYNMTEIGTDHGLGVVCYHEITLKAGLASYRFEAMDYQGNYLFLPKIGMYTLNITATGSAPTLTNASVDPQNPNENESIDFSVLYTDIDNDPPTYVKVMILSAYNDSTPITLNMMTPYSYSYDMGVLFNASITLLNGTYNYRFITHSSNDTVYMPPFEFYGLTVGSSNTLPILSNGDASPSEPEADTQINFTVVYSDPAGTRWPHMVQLAIHKNSQEGEIFNMSYSDLSLTQGVTYFKTMSLSSGNYSYHFLAIVGNYSIRYPPVGSNLNLYVNPMTPIDNAPVLSSGTHTPLSPSKNQNVTFSVNYKDTDGDAPTYIMLNLVPKTIKTLTSTVYNMSWTGTSYSTGITASYVLSLAADSYNYFFVTESNNKEAYYPSNGYLTLTVSSVQPPQDAAPVLYSPGINPSKPTSGQSLNFSIYYKDTDGDAPIYVRLFLSSGGTFAQYNLVTLGTTYNTGVNNYYMISLATGNYTYYYKTASKNHTITYPTDGSISINVPSSNDGDRDNISSWARFSLDDSDSIAMEIIYVDEFTSLQVLEYKEDLLKILLSSEDGAGKIVVMEIEDRILGSVSVNKLEVLMDGIPISYIEKDSLYRASGNEPLYYLAQNDGVYELHIYIPEAGIHSLTTKNPDDDVAFNDFWIIIILALVVVIIAIVVSIFLLTVAQKTKKMEVFYQDFNIGEVEKSKVTGGTLDDKNEELEWEEML